MKENTVSVVELTEVETTLNNEEASLIKNDMGIIGELPVNLHVELGEFSTTVKELYELKVGSVVSLGTKVDETIKVYFKDRVVAQGVLVAVDEHYAIEITDIAEMTY